MTSYNKDKTHTNSSCRELDTTFLLRDHGNPKGKPKGSGFNSKTPKPKKLAPYFEIGLPARSATSLITASLFASITAEFVELFGLHPRSKPHESRIQG